MNLDYRLIRSYDGSQQNGFEEMVCQLARLSPPVDAKKFIRKEGSGGDAGIECYWVLNNGDEHGWQAKYFIDNISTNQWSQIDESVKTALEKHPKLTVYYVCLPRDWTDSRKDKKGKKVESALDKWNKKVKEWELIASNRGMSVEFTYWSKNELSLMLTRPEPTFSGRALYWFKEPRINFKKLEGILISSQNTLGERYSEEFNLELPIIKSLDGLGFHPRFNDTIKEHIEILENTQDDINTIDTKDNNSLFEELKLSFNSYIQFLEELKDSERFISFINDIEKKTEDLDSLINKCHNFVRELQSDTQTKKDDEIERVRKLTNNIFEIQRKINNFSKFIFSHNVQGGAKKAILLVGKAGIGKSHLLCDLALKRLEIGLPSIFLLGQHYTGGNPLDFIIERLDLKNFSKEQVLGALDALGESCKSRTLIIIDAINEGSSNKEWENHIVSFITELKKYPKISILLSCRSTYLDYLIPKSLNSDLILQIEHSGFRGFEQKAVALYAKRYEVNIPNIPLLSPEFTNPLFVKICFESLHESGENEFPKGLNGINKLFTFYKKSINDMLIRKKEYLSGENILDIVLNSFVEKSFPNNLFGIPLKDAISIFDNADTNKSYGDRLSNILIGEGIFSYDIDPNIKDNVSKQEVIRFTYQRFSDYNFADYIIKSSIENNDIKTCFKEGKILWDMMNQNYIYEWGGIFEAVTLILPEIYGIELLDLIPNESKYYNYALKQYFKDTLSMRSHNAFNERTLFFFKQISSDFHSDDKIEILLKFTTEPSHPWNAHFLDNFLRNLSLPERDYIWSTHIAMNYYEEDDDQAESILMTLIKWTNNTDFSNVESERILLLTIVLIWSCSTSNRKVRDHSTISLSKVFQYIPDKITSFIDKFSNIDDPYIVQRLYAAIYGAIFYIEDLEIIKSISQKVYEIQFNENEPYPDILLRDYARGILEYAIVKDCFPIGAKIENISPPHRSDWPLESPGKKEILDLMEKYGALSIKYSVGEYGDFGRYTMNPVHYFSATPLSEVKIKSGLEYHKEFAEKLPEGIKKQYLSYLINKVTGNLNIECLESIINGTEDVNPIKPDWEALKDEINNNTNDEHKEEFRWLSGISKDDRPAASSRKWAQRWVCNKVLSLGWTSEKFERFDEFQSRNSDRPNRKYEVERMGKKYQWIALFELLARMSDNLFWIGKGYSDIEDFNFYGPWQLDSRDIDPTLRINKTCYDPWERIHKICWWQPTDFPLEGKDLDSQKNWIRDKKKLPPVKDMVVVEDNNGIKWSVLHGFVNWKKGGAESRQIRIEQDAWVRINTIAIKKKDFNRFLESIV